MKTKNSLASDRSGILEGEAPAPPVALLWSRLKTEHQQMPVRVGIPPLGGCVAVRRHGRLPSTPVAPVDVPCLSLSGDGVARTMAEMRSLMEGDAL